MPMAPEAPGGLPRLGGAVDAPAALAVMNLAAHPDDEDGLTLAYYRGARNARAYSVIYTRGEGGQNEAGPELYERLGAIRTRETEAAARVLGTEVRFLNHYDFGFSKHAREAFAEWGAPQTSFWEPRPEALSPEAGRDSVVAGLVWTLRELRPHVVFTNHDTVTVGPERQHGHHQAVGISALEAVRLAADPAAFPEQLASGARPWQVQRLFLRRGGFSADAPEAYSVAVPVSDPCAATAYRPAEPCAERAVAAAAQHVSQGFDLFAPRFYRDTTYFQLLWAAPQAPPLPPGATDLAAGLTADPAPTPIDHLIAAGRVPPPAGLAADDSLAVPGGTVRVSWEARGEGTAEVFVLGARAASVPLASGGAEIAIPPEAAWTRPLHRAMYAAERTAHPVTVHVLREGQLAAAGHVPLAVAPPVVAEWPAEPVALREGDNYVPVRVQAHDPAASAAVLDARVWWDGRVRLPMATAATGADTTVAVQAASGARTERLWLPMEDPAPGPYEMALLALPDAASAPGALPFADVMPAAVLPDVRVARGLRVGFVRSYDGTMGEAMRTMGAEVVELDSLALAEGAFDGLHTVVIDIRAYLDRQDLRAHNGTLLAWVRERGGHLVVGYQKLFEWNAGRPHPLWPEDTNPPEGFAPYPLQLGRERVTMQDAPVTIRTPEHPLFVAPHLITPADWDGWVQERGLYFPTDAADARYARPLAMADRGEDPLTTALLLADVGRGTYLYSPLVWYRQLAALNPGAWRMFANLVSLPLTDGRHGAE